MSEKDERIDAVSVYESAAMFRENMESVRGSIKNFREGAKKVL